MKTIANEEEHTNESEAFIENGKPGKNKTAEQDTLSRAPIDRGWAWMILFGGVITNAIVVGCIRTNGILFVEFQRVFKSSSTVTSLITTIQNALFCISCLMVMTVGLKSIQCRIIVLIGSILLCVSYIINGVANNINIVMVSHGILQGFAIACVEPTTISMVSKYFKKRRGLSISLVSAGNSIGGLIFPPLVTKLFNIYGYMGCMLLIGAVHLNISVSAMLYRPLTMYGVQRHINQQVEDNKKKNKLKMLHQILSFLDFKLFLNPLFLLFLLGFAFMTSAAVLSIMYVPPLSTDLGISDERTATLMAIFSGVDMVSRISYGVIADTNILSRTTLVSIAGVIFGSCSLCVYFYTTFELLVMHVVIIGATSGAIKSLYPGIIVEYLSLKNLDSTIGFAMLKLGLINGVFVFVGGVLRDSTGSYVTTFLLIGSIALTGTLAIFALPFLRRWTKIGMDDVCSKLTVNIT